MGPAGRIAFTKADRETLDAPAAVSASYRGFVPCRGLLHRVRPRESHPVPGPAASGGHEPADPRDAARALPGRATGVRRRNRLRLDRQPAARTGVLGPRVLA